jgi:hypothetical protein
VDPAVHNQYHGSIRFCDRDPPSNITHRDYNTHDELHALLRNDTAPESPLRIEITVQCGDDSDGNENWLEQYCWLFYKWVAAMSVMGLEGQVLDIVLRPMPVSEVAAHTLAWNDPFTDDSLTDAYWLNQSWRCSVGAQVGLAEWTESWGEGIRY